MSTTKLNKNKNKPTQQGTSENLREIIGKEKKNKDVEVCSSEKGREKGEASSTGGPKIACLDLTYDEDTGASQRTDEAFVKEMGRIRIDSASSVGSRSSVSSFPDSLCSLPRRTRDTKEQTGRENENPKKRTEVTEHFVLEEALDMISSLYKVLEKNIETNTKREIKDIVRRMGRQVATINGNVVRNWLLQHKYDRGPETKTAKTQTRSNTIEMGTQTDSDGILYEIHSCENYDEWREQADAKWDGSVFSASTVTKGSITEIINADVSVILVEDGDVGMTKGIAKVYGDRYPCIRNVKEDLAILEQKSSIRVRDNNSNKEETQKVIKITFDGTEKDLFYKVAKLKQETLTDKNIALHEINMDIVRFRKLMENFYRGSDTKITIYEEEKKRSYARAAKKQKIKGTYALIVEGQEGMTYNDVLKNVKEVLGKEENQDNIRGLRSTRDGKLLIIADKDERALERTKTALKDTCNRIGKMYELANGEDLESVHIRGLDTLTTKEDVKLALGTCVESIEDCWLKISDLRPTKNGTQNVTVTANKAVVEKLLEARTVRVGLNRCFVDMRIKMAKCIKCWSYGHETSQCDGPDRRKLCYKCGQDGHISKDCQGNEECPLCDEKGHRAGSGRCTDFRRSLSIQKAREAGTTEEEQEDREVRKQIQHTNVTS